MESRAKLAGHAIHPMLITLPLGLLTAAGIFDVLALVRKNKKGELARVAFWMIAAGIIGGLSAAPFGWWDWLAIPTGTRAKQVGLTHGATNVLVLTLFTLSWLQRRKAPEQPNAAALASAFAGLGLAVVGGWLGGELVERLGMGVQEGANLDASNTLSGRPAWKK